MKIFQLVQKVQVGQLETWVILLFIWGKYWKCVFVPAPVLYTLCTFLFSAHRVVNIDASICGLHNDGFYFFFQFSDRCCSNLCDILKTCQCFFSVMLFLILFLKVFFLECINTKYNNGLIFGYCLRKVEIYLSVIACFSLLSN